MSPKAKQKSIALWQLICIKAAISGNMPAIIKWIDLNQQDGKNQSLDDWLSKL